MENFLKNLLALDKSKKILLLGLGQENQQFLNWLINVLKFSPTRIVISEKKNFSKQEIINFLQNQTKQDSKEKLSIDLEQMLTFFGLQQWDFLKKKYINQIEYIFKSPGIWSLDSRLEEFRKQKGQSSVLSPLVFFIEKFRSQIIGITGTKGKTTTSSLTFHFLKTLLRDSTENKIVYCGNTVGISPYRYWLDLDQKVDPEKYFVLELSSFQLQDLGFAKLSPHLSAITNYFIDHQDQHQSPEEYWEAKDQIWMHQTSEDFLVANAQIFSRSKLKHLSRLGMKKNFFMIEEKIAEELASILNFSNSKLQGLHNKLNLSLAIFLTELVRLQTTNQSLENLDPVYFLKQVQKRQHFYKNCLKTFEPVKHRLELIRSVQV